MNRYFKGFLLGTDNNLDFIRLTDAVRLSKNGEKTDDGTPFKELLHDGETRFRFQFPQEDHLEGFYRFTRINNVKLPYKHILNDSVQHTKITVQSALPNNIKSVGIVIDCPDKSSQSNYFYQPELDVRYQAFREGRIKTIFVCERCGQAQTFNDTTLLKYKKELNKYVLNKKAESLQGVLEQENMLMLIARL